MVRILSVLCTAFFLTACGTSCDQDSSPASIIQTSQNPYQLSRRSTDLDIVSARWENQTTNEIGGATVYQDYGCIFLFGCGTLTHIDASIPLSPGLNRVIFYEDEGDCEWREDIEITLN
jgi:major membrane immunogen (membrane-anchored lipoprotein)